VREKERDGEREKKIGCEEDLEMKRFRQKK
jgi:hypothetical protein